MIVCHNGHYIGHVRYVVRFYRIYRTISEYVRYFIHFKERWLPERIRTSNFVLRRHDFFRWITGSGVCPKFILNVGQKSIIYTYKIESSLIFCSSSRNWTRFASYVKAPLCRWANELSSCGSYLSIYELHCPPVRYRSGPHWLKVSCLHLFATRG